MSFFKSLTCTRISAVVQESMCAWIPLLLFAVSPKNRTKFFWSTKTIDLFCNQFTGSVVFTKRESSFSLRHWQRCKYSSRPGKSRKAVAYSQCPCKPNSRMQAMDRISVSFVEKSLNVKHKHNVSNWNDLVQDLLLFSIFAQNMVLLKQIIKIIWVPYNCQNKRVD